MYNKAPVRRCDRCNARRRQLQRLHANPDGGNALWRCRRCDALTCEHLCSLKAAPHTALCNECKRARVEAEPVPFAFSAAERTALRFAADAAKNDEDRAHLNTLYNKLFDHREARKAVTEGRDPGGEA